MQWAMIRSLCESCRESGLAMQLRSRWHWSLWAVFALVVAARQRKVAKQIHPRRSAIAARQPLDQLVTNASCRILLLASLTCEEPRTPSSTKTGAIFRAVTLAARVDGDFRLFNGWCRARPPVPLHWMVSPAVEKSLGVEGMSTEVDSPYTPPALGPDKRTMLSGWPIVLANHFLSVRCREQ